MPAHPLTHHEILRLVAPFTRAGRHPDLALSNRLERRLVFKSIDHPAAGPLLPEFSETLHLESFDGGGFSLKRVVRLVSGDEAELETEGDEPGAMLEAIEGIRPESQFRCVEGIVVATSYRLEGPQTRTRFGRPIRGQAHGPAPGQDPEQDLLAASFSKARARLGLASVVLVAPRGKGSPTAELDLLPDAARTLEWPEDLIAVLGPGFGLLRGDSAAWKANLKLSGREPARTQDAEQKLERVVDHLVEVLGASPREFGERFYWKRWAVVGRRALPLLVCILLVMAAAATIKLHLAEDSALRMLIFNAPTWLLMLVFCMREVPRIEIPPWPRRLELDHWATLSEARAAEVTAPPADPSAPALQSLLENGQAHGR
jgi:hypothetical protein